MASPVRPEKGPARRRFFRRPALPRSGTVAAAMSVLGLMGLAYLFGAATLLLDLPPAESLRKAFSGGRAWTEREQALNQPPRGAFPGFPGQTTVDLDRPGQTCDGFTLVTTNEGAVAVLLDMRGKEVHRWQLPFDPSWRPASAGLRAFRPDQVHWFRAHLFPNGDLLAVYHADGDTPYGYGLVKVDRDSRLLWVYTGNAHHDLDVSEDGTIYALTQKLVDKPPAGMEWFPTPYISDALVILSADGKEQANIPLLEAFRDSPYALTFSFLDRPREGEAPLRIGPILPHGPHPTPPMPPMPVLPPGQGAPIDTDDAGKGDFLHANSVRVLSRSRAAKFPLFKPGQVLVSLRTPNLLAVLDPKSHAVVWASLGIWRGQHDAEFLDNGNLLVYDNHGSPRGSRVLEYNPRTQAIPWCYASEEGDRFIALTRGTKQRLANGNTMLADPDGARLLEVTPARERVWECRLPLPPGASITGAWRHAPDTLTFLKGAVRARP